MSLKRSEPRLFRLAAIIGLTLMLGACGADPGPPPPPPLGQSIDGPPEALPPEPADTFAPATSQAASACDAPLHRDAARANVASLRALAWAPFGRPETGWEVYAPLVAREIGVDCAPHSEGFAAALATWQSRRGLSGGGRMTPATFELMKGEVQSRRPFVRVSSKTSCPAPPAASNLAAATGEEGYGGKAVELRPAALDAYRRMSAAARAASPAIAADKRNLTIFSAYRAPEYDAARCEREQNCDGVARATCSPHRTGLAIDIFVGAAPGYGPDSSADPNRLFQSKTATYRWLLANAPRFGFVNYPFEPWHWEWIGEAP